MDFPWPMEREANLIPSGSYAAEYYAYVLANGLFPNYVKNTLEKFQNSDI